jgi:hypothetical protein
MGDEILIIKNNYNKWGLLTKSNKSKMKLPALKKTKLLSITLDSSRLNWPNIVPNFLSLPPRVARVKVSKSADLEMLEFV